MTRSRPRGARRAAAADPTAGASTPAPATGGTVAPGGPEATPPGDGGSLLGAPGASFDRESAFIRGLTGACGVAVVVAVAWLVIQVSSELILIGLALFIAVGLEPAVRWLQRKRFPRGVAVTVVLVLAFGSVAGFLATAIPVVVAQATQVAAVFPAYLQSPAGHASLLGRLDGRFHFQQVLEQTLTADNGATVVGAGEAVVGGLASTVIVVALVVYFLADLPRLRRTAGRLIPASRRTRATLLADEILAKVGGYVLGSLLLALIAGTSTLVLLLILGISYAVLLAVLVALLDLVPVIGSILGGLVVAAVALGTSVTAGIATVIFFVAYRLVEDYLLLPRIIGRTVNVPALVTLVAVVLGAALLGPVGAIVAIPLAAAALLILREVVIPHFDRT
jgi:predicted PurR-regulated permease PerM